MKGFLPITIAIIGLIATATIFVALTLPLFVLKYHLAINVEQEYDYNNAQLILLTILSYKYNESYSMYQVLAERNVNGFDESMKAKIEDVGKILTGGKCFRIVNQTSTVFEISNCSAKKSSGEIYIFKPYNKQSLIEKLILVYE
jgi:hypothetical protein